MMRTATLPACLIVWCCATLPPATAQSPATHQHSFGDAQKWAQVFDDPQRDAWQKPHEVIRALALEPDAVIADILEFANQITGEPIILDSAMTELSGGQSRALLIADAVVIGNSPIILLDEIENAWINLTRTLELLRKYEKIFIFVTHDPRITLSSDYRIVMKGGAMQDAITTSPGEKRIGERVTHMDKVIVGLRDQIRSGERMQEKEFQAVMELAWTASGPI